MKVLAFILALVAVTLTATALPFLPGRYDVLAVPLSGIARTVGMVSLLLVPLGLAWLGYELWWSGEGASRTRVGFVVTSLGAGSVAVFAGAVFAFGLSGAPLMVGVLASWVLGLWRGGPRTLEWGRRSRGRQTVPALAIVLVPGVVVGAQLAMSRPLTSFAWKHTMDGMEPLIADIERYRATNGRYPHSLFSEWMDYRPSVIGVRGYQYETSGEVFSLAVQVPTFSFDSQEYLLYNPADNHVMASHDADLLLRTSAELVQYRGYYTAHSLDRPHWTLLSFD
jgi:hypothetical protein